MRSTNMMLLLACGGLLLAALCACPANKPAGQATSSNAPAVGQKINVTPPAPTADAPAPVAPPAGLTVTAFTVAGMTCDDCSRSIEAALIKLPGVTTVSADYKAGLAKVQYDQAQSTPEQLRAAIEQLGFTATEQSTGEAKTPPATGA